MMKLPHLPRRRFLIVACVCAAFGGALVYAQTRHETSAGATAAAGKAEYVTAIGALGAASMGTPARGGIRKQAVQSVTRPATLRLTGSLAADERSEVGCNVGGIVLKTYVERGSIVKQGDLLVQLDPRDNQYALDEGQNAVEELRVRLGLDEAKDFHVEKVPEVESATLALQLAERNYRRAESLMKRNAIALSDFDALETDYHSAVHRQRLAVLQAKQLYRSYRSAVTHLTTLRKALEDCSIRAPFDGWVTERGCSLGERVIAIFPGAKLVTMMRIDPLRLSLTVPQQEVSQLKAGQTVTFETDAFAGRKFTGTVRYITPAVTSDSRSLCVEAMVPNPGAVLYPGLFVTAELQLEKQQTELYVPQAAVCNRGDVAAVFVVRGGVVREQIVSVGEAAAGRVRITSGLAPGDIIITTPEKVRDGDSES